MGKLLGFGMTDYPAMQMTDLKMSRSLQNALSFDRVPDEKRDQDNWPEEMRQEWGRDMGKTTARAYRTGQLEQFRKVRKTLEDFNPDVVIMLAKDHCETTGDREDPPASPMFLPYWICAFDEVTVKPFQPGNMLEESPSTDVVIPGAHDFGIRLANGLRDHGHFPAVLNVPSSPAGLAHTYRSTVALLDWDQRNRTFPFRVLPIPFNPFGSRGRDQTGLEPRKPEHWLPPTMREAFALGEAIASVVMAGDERVAIGVGAGWSHANNTSWDSAWLSADVQADRELFKQWQAGDTECLAKLTPDELEEHGWWEMWGWAVVAGAMKQAGAEMVHAHLQTNYIFNSNWVTTIFQQR